MKWKWLAAVMLVFAAACGQGSSDALDERNASGIENELEAPAVSSANDDKGKQETEEASEEGMTNEPDEDEAELPNVPEETAEAETLYRMTEIYTIVPIEEGADKNVVLLTFDDGPKDETMVTTMLEVLEKHEAKAIFFVNGFRVEQNPELLKMIHEKGHAIGNHSWDHINLREASNDQIDQQVEAVQRKVEELTGEAPQFFRPPHGAGNDYLKQKVKEEGMLYMTWSTSPEDWLAQNQTAEKVIELTLERVHPGANLLMHEVPWTVEALDEMLTKLKEKGYAFVDPHAIEIALD